MYENQADEKVLFESKITKHFWKAINAICIFKLHLSQTQWVELDRDICTVNTQQATALLNANWHIKKNKKSPSMQFAFQRIT